MKLEIVTELAFKKNITAIGSVSFKDSFDDHLCKIENLYQTLNHENDSKLSFYITKSLDIDEVNSFLYGLGLELGMAIVLSERKLYLQLEFVTNTGVDLHVVRELLDDNIENFDVQFTSDGFGVQTFIKVVEDDELNISSAMIKLGTQNMFRSILNDKVFTKPLITKIKNLNDW